MRRLIGTSALETTVKPYVRLGSMFRSFLPRLAAILTLALTLPGVALAQTSPNPAGPPTSQPLAGITSPMAGAHVSGLVPIVGSADWPNALVPYNFASYTMEWGSGNNPASFSTFDMGSSPVAGGQLSNWNVAALPDGPYILRMAVNNNTGNYARVVVPVIVDNSGTYSGPAFPVSSPTPQPTGTTASAIVINSSSYMDPTAGQLHIVGEVKNNGNANLQFVQVAATFKDASGNPLQSGLGYTALPILVPGQTSPFEIYTQPPAGMAGSADLVVTFSTTANPPASGLSVSNDSIQTDSQGRLHITGVATNSRLTTVNSFRVAYTIRDTNGTAIRTGTFSTVTGVTGQAFSLLAGSSGPFDYVVPNTPPSFGSYSLAIQ